MKMKKMFALLLALNMVFILAACGGSSAPASSEPAAAGDTGGETAVAEAGEVPNAEKPVIWFNRQPSNSTTGELDMDALTFNDKTYYVGFDAKQGAELQGQMVVDYPVHRRRRPQRFHRPYPRRP